MKNCPYCTKSVQDDAIYCIYCIQGLYSPIEPTHETTKVPPVILCLLVGILLFVVIYGILFAIASNWSGTYSDLESFSIFYQLGVMAIVTLLAISILESENLNLSKIRIFILVGIPIGGWAVVYWVLRVFIL